MLTATRTRSIATKVHANRGMLFPFGCVGLLLVLLIPLPRQILDLLLVFSLTMSIVILVTAIHIKSPREFAVFPSLLLAVTLFRLVLNVATTRLILSGGGEEWSAGQVVGTFSNLVTQGSVTVGAIIFLIIFVIQFVVITKGGGRISEVAARFVLDAMPGKQMAIDADVNAGLITQQEAHQRREQIARDADFYSAMDGAGKFVRGDAIACVVITVVNIVGGLYVGMVEHGIPLDQCLKLYTKLTIGDGLVSQVPAFIVSLAAGLIVTRTSGESDLGEDVLGQMLAKPQALLVAAVFLAILAAMGMPTLPLLIMGSCCAGLAYILGKRNPTTVAEVIEESAQHEPQHVERLLDMDVLELELGPGLVRLVDLNRGGDLLQRVTAVREQIAVELGIIVPAIGIRDSAAMGMNDYAIRIRGQVIARGAAYPEQFLAIDDGDADGPIVGEAEIAEPSRGRLAYWITESQQGHAQTLGYVVVEAPAFIIAHLIEVIRDHAHELLTRQTVRSLLDNLKSRAAAVVEEVVPHLVRPGDVQKVLQNLLRERVPVRDLETILETLGDYASRTKDTELLTEHVRVALARTICRQYVDEHDRLQCLMLEAGLEELIAGHVEHSEGAGAGDGSINTMPPATVQRIGQAIAQEATVHARDGRPPVVLCAPAVRSAVRKLLEPVAPLVAVLSLAEVVGDVAPEVVGVVGDESGDDSGDGVDDSDDGLGGGLGDDLGGSGNNMGNFDDRRVEDGYESANV
jgi:flagellar biosynthesis protein FlhA